MATTGTGGTRAAATTAATNDRQARHEQRQRPRKSAANDDFNKDHVGGRRSSRRWSRDHGHDGHGGGGHHGSHCRPGDAGDERWVSIDRQVVIDPSRFGKQVSIIEQRLRLPGGAHKLSAIISGNPGSAITVTVNAAVTWCNRASCAASTSSCSTSMRSPRPFSPAHTTTTLSALGTIRRLPPNERRLVLRWTFEIRSAASCDVVKVLSGESLAEESVVFAPQAVWDGTLDNGTPVGDGSYYYRLVAQLVRKHHRGEQIIDAVATAQQGLGVDTTAAERRDHTAARRLGARARRGAHRDPLVRSGAERFRERRRSHDSYSHARRTSVVALLDVRLDALQQERWISLPSLTERTPCLSASRT